MGKYPGFRQYQENGKDEVKLDKFGMKPGENRDMFGEPLLSVDEEQSIVVEKFDSTFGNHSDAYTRDVSK